MMPRIPYAAGHTLRLPARGGVTHDSHIFEQGDIDAIETALSARRPLLLRGEPGAGKSQLARAAAVALDRAFVQHVVDGHTETRDLLWTVDHVTRLAEAQVAGAGRGKSSAGVRSRLDLQNFIVPGALWWAFEWASAAEQDSKMRAGLCVREVPDGFVAETGSVVLLVDEIDKADVSVPNGLLDALGHGRFEVPGRDPVAVDADSPPLVVVTTNEERSLPDAFLRRCLVHHLRVPDGDDLVRWLVRRGRAHFEACAVRVLKAAAAQVAEDRATVKRRRLSPPGQAEYLDLLRAVTDRETTPAGQVKLLKRIKRFALEKHPPEDAP